MAKRSQLLVGGLIAAGLVSGVATGFAQDQRAVWNETQAGFKIFGNSYFVGTKGLGSVLVTSPGGHVLLDGALPESVPKIVANIRALGFKVEDVKLIVNSHVHYDHAGGIGELQRLSGARVAASAIAAKVLGSGQSGPDDPQYGILPPIARATKVEVVKDGDTLKVGSLSVTVHTTPGHTPGGTSWSWQSCEAARCLNMVYADSLSPVSADSFLFTRTTSYPTVLEDFEKSYRTLEALPCDIVVTPHPGFTNLFDKLAERDAGKADALVDAGACKRYAAAGRKNLAQRVATERSAR
jgi:metallo-beta-lactamase class B